MTKFKTLLQRPIEFWHDREIRFDLPPSELSPCPGEHIIETFADVEDCRGNPNEYGTLVITVLRLLWVHPRARINLSVGYNTIVMLDQSPTVSVTKINGKTSSFIMQCQMMEARFEFVFGTDSDRAVSIAALLGDMHRMYCGSRIYRDFKVKAMIVKESALETLPLEVIHEKAVNTINLASDKHSIGRLYITNIRIAWHASATNFYNVSIPYCQIKDVRIQGSKFGTSLVIETTKSSGSYILGFQVHPIERMKELAKAIKKSIKAYAERPIFGMKWAKEQDPQQMMQVQNALHLLQKMKVIEDDIEILPLDPQEDLTLRISEARISKASVYSQSKLNGGPKNDLVEWDDLVRDETLGMVIEKIKTPGLTIKQLWKMA
ncbi:Bardet-Biedl syndrome 5 protein [Phlyctochytrium planicorne]|nr:Bardet-Biedl syndrome 5 protein [Phlyctochytrium planicorne]